MKMMNYIIITKNNEEKEVVNLHLQGVRSALEAPYMEPKADPERIPEAQAVLTVADLRGICSGEFHPQDCLARAFRESLRPLYGDGVDALEPRELQAEAWIELRARSGFYGNPEGKKGTPRFRSYEVDTIEEGRFILDAGYCRRQGIRPQKVLWDLWSLSSSKFTEKWGTDPTNVDLPEYRRVEVRDYCRHLDSREVRSTFGNGVGKPMSNGCKKRASSEIKK